MTTPDWPLPVWLLRGRSSHSISQAMTTDELLMKAYGRAAGLHGRFCILLLGVFGFFFPGWFVHQIMRLFKTGAENDNFNAMLELTQKINL